MGVPIFSNVPKGVDEEQLKCDLEGENSISVTVLSSSTPSSTHEEDLTEEEKNEVDLIWTAFIILFVLALGVVTVSAYPHSNSMMQTEKTEHQNSSSTHVEFPQIEDPQIENQVKSIETSGRKIDSLITCGVTLYSDIFRPTYTSECKWRLDGSEGQGWGVSFKKVSTFLPTLMMKVIFQYGKDEEQTQFHFYAKKEETLLSVPKDLKVWMILPPTWNNMRIVLKRPKKNRVVETCSVTRSECDEENDVFDKKTFESCEVFHFSIEWSDSCISNVNISGEGLYKIDMEDYSPMFDSARILTPLWHGGVHLEDRFNFSTPYVKVGYYTPRTLRLTRTWYMKPFTVKVYKLKEK